MELLRKTPLSALPFPAPGFLLGVCVANSVAVMQTVNPKMEMEGKAIANKLPESAARLLQPLQSLQRLLRCGPPGGVLLQALANQFAQAL